MFDVSRIVDTLRLTPIERQRYEFDRMLLDGDPPPHVSTREDVFGEDYVASLLSSPHTPPIARQVCLEGCQRLYAEFESLLASGKALSTPQKLVFQRLCSVVNLGQPPELAATAIRVAMAVLDLPDASRTVLGASARAALAFLPTGEQAGLWDRMIHRKEISGYGYKAVLALHAADTDRLAKELAGLWAQRLGSGWPVNVAYLMADTTTARPDLDPELFQIIVLELLRSQRPELENRAAQEIDSPPPLFPATQ